MNNRLVKLGGLSAALVLGTLALPATAATVTLNPATTGWTRPGTAFSPSNMIIGESTGSLEYAGIEEFLLPSLAPGETITNASLSFVTTVGGKIVGANTDIWALGLLSSPAVTTSQYLGADTDATTGHTKLVDNFINANTYVSGTRTTTSPQNATITAYIQSLYTTLGNANVAGKYLVIRVNPDDTLATSDGSFRFATYNNATKNSLTLTTAVTVIPEPATAAMGAALLAIAGLSRRRRGN